MYIDRNGLKLWGIDDFLGAVGGQIGAVGGDWLKKQMGMPTSAEVQQSTAAAQVAANKEVAQASIATQAAMQRYMIIAGAGLLAVGVVAFFITRKG